VSRLSLFRIVGIVRRNKARSLLGLDARIMLRNSIGIRLARPVATAVLLHGLRKRGLPGIGHGHLRFFVLFACS